MDRDEALRLLRGGPNGVKKWNSWRGVSSKCLNLDGADLRGAGLGGVHLSSVKLYGANLEGADLRRVALGYAKLDGANLKGANLSDADLYGADLEGADLSYADLRRARLISANLGGANLNGTDLTRAVLFKTNLTRSRLIRSNLTEASVDRALVVEVQIEQLIGLPLPPELLRLDENGDAVLVGDEAASFFLKPEVVKVVLDRPLRHESLGGYYAYIAECEAGGYWPEGVAYLGGHVERGQTVLSFQAPKASDVVGNLSLLLKPFRLAGAVDFQKILVSFAGEEAEPMVEAILARPEFRSLIAERLQQFEGFADARPSEIRTGGAVFKLEMDPKAVAELQPGAILAPQLQLTVIEGDQNVTMEETEIHADRGSVVNVKSHLQNVRILLQASQTEGPNIEDDLHRKVEEFSKKLEQAGERHSEEVELLARRLEELTTLATKPGRERNKGLLTMSAKGLKEAAEAVGEIAPGLLKTASEMASMISNLTG